MKSYRNIIREHLCKHGVKFRYRKHKRKWMRYNYYFQFFVGRSIAAEIFVGFGTFIMFRYGPHVYEMKTPMTEEELVKRIHPFVIEYLSKKKTLCSGEDRRVAPVC